MDNCFHCGFEIVPDPDGEWLSYRTGCAGMVRRKICLHCFELNLTRNAEKRNEIMRQRGIEQIEKSLESY